MDVTPSGGRIAIETGVKKEYIYLRISDTGSGIPQEELHRIFEPLYSTRGRAGMGLPLVKQIVLEHAGEITIDSEPDKGTIVEMLFPMRWRERDLETKGSAGK
jgi:signal transduction histidine kinase